MDNQEFKPSDNTKYYTVNPKPLKISQEQVDNILDAALAFGIGHWCADLEVVLRTAKKKPSNFVSECLTRGCDIKIGDAVAQKYHVLTLKKFLKGLSLYKKSNYDEFDSVDADDVVQLALFGEVIYG